MAKKPKQIETYDHAGGRKNIPTAEMQSVAEMVEETSPIEPVSFSRETPLAEGERRERNEGLDPQLIWKGVKITITAEQARQLSETGELSLGEAQLVWRGKDEQDWSDLVVNVPPIYVQEKIHPRVLIDELKKMSDKEAASGASMVDLFADFNGIDLEARTEFYQHDVHWTNRMILGDSLQVMASLAEREALRGKVQCIYFDPPYGIKFNSNWQVSTRNRDVKDGKLESLTREPEQVKAFRDTWKDGIHSYLTYLRDRLTAARDLLTESGSIFVQIGDENVHRVRALMDEVFGEENFISEIKFKTTSNRTAEFIPSVFDSVVFYARDRSKLKFRSVKALKSYDDVTEDSYGVVEVDRFEWRRLNRTEKDTPKVSEKIGQLFGMGDLTSSHEYIRDYFSYTGSRFHPKKRYWSTSIVGLTRLGRGNRLCNVNGTLRYKRIFSDSPTLYQHNIWSDTGSGSQTESRTYVVQTISRAIERCILMTTDPGDIVLDPTCGSGTSATVAEQWGRKWITIDTSRVALALARTRLMSARYPYYLMADTPEGRRKEAEVSGRVPPEGLSQGDLSQGFVYERAPHITLKSIANNAEIDVIWGRYEARLKAILAELTIQHTEGWLDTYRLDQNYDVEVPDQIQEWEMPRNIPDVWLESAEPLHAEFWKLRIARQSEIDISIGQKADVELLYDRPYEDKSRVRVAGPFTVESLSPHRVVPMDDRDDILDESDKGGATRSSIAPEEDFAQVVLDYLRKNGVQQSKKGDKLTFTHLGAWPGNMIAAEAHFNEGSHARRAGILLGPEYGSLTRNDITAAAREAIEARFDILIALGFAFDAHSTGLDKLGPLPILKAKMNPDLHMASDLKDTGKGNMFMVIGEPDIDVEESADGMLTVRLHGMDVFVPKTGEIRSGEKDDIAAWFIDTEYNEESFFVRHAYFLGAGDPYKSLKTSLRAEINKEAWETLRRDVSRPFPRPESGRIAVKVINHFGDEVMKVFTV